ncbi:MAG TPA: hypothetical protein PK680_03930 [Novosphingobium sp.]|nr:hypothetical protein [Novosphingobium sp.]
MAELPPDPLDKRPKDDLPFVGTGCLGIFLTLFGGYMLWGVLHGEAFRGNVGRTMNFADRLELSCGFVFAGVITLLLVRWLRRRLR